MHPIKVKALQILTPARLTPRQSRLCLQESVRPVVSNQSKLLDLIGGSSERRAELQL